VAVDVGDDALVEQSWVERTRIVPQRAKLAHQRINHTPA